MIHMCQWSLDLEQKIICEKFLTNGWVTWWQWDKESLGGNLVMRRVQSKCGPLEQLSFCSIWMMYINSYPLSAVYMLQWTGSALVQVMAWRRTGDKPLPEPALIYCQLDHWQKLSVKIESKFQHFHSKKCVWICCLRNCVHFVQGDMN